MDSRHGKMRMDVEVDRLSSLPNDIIHKILSFMDIKVAIATSVLSSRWRFIWKSMPYLNFSTEELTTLPKFSKFATNVLSHRENLIDVYSMKLNIRLKASNVLVKKLLNYAFSHNIQQLNVVCLLENNIEFPLSPFSSQSLKHLSLTLQHSKYYHPVCNFTSASEFPTLTTLELCSVTLHDDSAGVFSKCANLKNLTLIKVKTAGTNGLTIFHPSLLHLTLKYQYGYRQPIKISAPDLVSLNFEDFYPLHVSTEGFHSLEKADICFISPSSHQDAHHIVCLLQQLHNVHFLALNLESVEVLSKFMDLILHQPSPFMNLKSLKIYPGRVNLWDKIPKKVTISSNLKKYLLGSYPGSTFTTVLHEEIIAQKLLAELVDLLEREKAHVELKAKKELKVGGKIAQLKNGWKNLGVQLLERKNTALAIISKLQRIEELLPILPASKRAKIEPCFSSLCAEADIAISQITDFMVNQCVENQSHSSVCFHELGTTSEPSS